jgi:hypothetical protein
VRAGRLAAGLVLALLIGSTWAATGAQATASTHYTGVLPDGGSWIADVPADWNGTLLLYSHGYGSNTPQDSPDSATQQALLDRGYALAGSSYDPTGSLWALGSAVPDQLATLSAVKRDVLPSPPGQVLAFGTSMGGLISALEAQRPERPIDGALTTCGIVAGGVQLGNYQLDGEYAMSRLLAPGQPVKLVNFSTQAEAVLTAQQLNTAAQLAQGTAAGRARLALALGLMNVTTWAPNEPMPAPGDYAAQEQGQYDDTFGAFPVMLFIETGRQQIEQAAGGNPAWTAGIDFARLLTHSSYRREITALYRAAGLDLRADLQALSAGAKIKADTAAVRWMQSTSAPTGRLAVPELDLHTISDQLVPVQHENHYGDLVRRARSSALLRQAFVQRQAHCNFTPAELVAGVLAVQHRVASGRWGSVASAQQLNASATSLGLGDAAFIHYRPDPLSGDNGPFDPARQGNP